MAGQQPQNIDPNTPIRIDTTITGINLLLKALGDLPARESFEMIVLVRTQTDAQLKTPQPEPQPENPEGEA